MGGNGSENSENPPGTMTVLTHGKFIKLFFKIARLVGGNHSEISEGSENSKTSETSKREFFLRKSCGGCGFPVFLR